MKNDDGLGAAKLAPKVAEGGYELGEGVGVDLSGRETRPGGGRLGSDFVEEEACGVGASCYQSLHYARLDCNSDEGRAFAFGGLACSAVGERESVFFYRGAGLVSGCEGFR